MSTSHFATMMAVGGEVILDEAALLIAAALRPGLDDIEWLAALDRLAGDCPTPTADGVARYLFSTLAFTGNESSYYDWRNSCLDRVIATSVHRVEQDDRAGLCALEDVSDDLARVGSDLGI